MQLCFSSLFIPIKREKKQIFSGWWFHQTLNIKKGKKVNEILLYYSLELFVLVTNASDAKVRAQIFSNFMVHAITIIRVIIHHYHIICHLYNSQYMLYSVNGIFNVFTVIKLYGYQIGPMSKNRLDKTNRNKLILWHWRIPTSSKKIFFLLSSDDFAIVLWNTWII
jgi:hypothetical protein